MANEQQSPGNSPEVKPEPEVDPPTGEAPETSEGGAFEPDWHRLVDPAGIAFLSETPALRRIETRFDSWEAHLEAQERRREEADRILRGYFTDEIGKLRNAILDELRERAIQKFLHEALPVLNDLDDALEQCRPVGDDPAAQRIWGAVSASRRRVYNNLRRFGLEQVAVIERTTLFDPSVHECLDAIETPAGTEGLPAGTVLEVRRKGYRLQGEILQTPQVIIAAGE